MKSQSILVECQFLLVKSDWTTFLLANLVFSWWTHLFFHCFGESFCSIRRFFSKDQTSSGAAGTSMSLTTTCRVTWHMVCGHPYHGNPKHNPVGGIPTPLKNMKVSWNCYSQLNGQKRSSKPPTSNGVSPNEHGTNGYIWVNYNISLTWIKAIWGRFPLLTIIPVRSQWGRDQIYPDIWWYMTIPRGYTMQLLTRLSHELRGP